MPNRDGGSGGAATIPSTIITNNTTLTRYPIQVVTVGYDASVSALTIKFPAAPQAGDVIFLQNGGWAACTVDGNGKLLGKWNQAGVPTHSADRVWNCYVYDPANSWEWVIS